MDALFRNLHHLSNLRCFLVDATLDSQCSDLVKDCLHALGKAVPDTAEEINIEIETHEEFESICQAASRHIPNVASS